MFPYEFKNLLIIVDPGVNRSGTYGIWAGAWLDLQRIFLARRGSIGSLFVDRLLLLFDLILFFWL